MKDKKWRYRADASQAELAEPVGFAMNLFFAAARGRRLPARSCAFCEVPLPTLYPSPRACPIRSRNRVRNLAPKRPQKPWTETRQVSTRNTSFEERFTGRKLSQLERREEAWVASSQSETCIASTAMSRSSLPPRRSSWGILAHESHQPRNAAGSSLTC
jgi:hypothetical protein